MRRTSRAGRYAERVLYGFDDDGADERIVIWIERKAGGVWAVGRTVNPQHRRSEEPRGDDYVFEGYELDDALEQANASLEADLSASRPDRRNDAVELFARDEVLRPLERWFFGRSPG
jgi:hypothetical protein